MANESIRLRTTVGNNPQNIRFKLEQEFDFLEVLSLKITQEDLYQTFCADYGVVVGRVLANKGFGVPNAKVSIFIPISDEDEVRTIIKDFYPYKTPFQKNSEGIRYNLLLTKADCYLNKPVGTFPTKEEFLDNDVILEVFEKYYKYTTKTNNSGDFMLFGVPVGQYTLHMDVDLSDIGKSSIRPYDLIASGYPEKLFDSPSEFKISTNLDTLAQIKTANVGIDVIPFWGDNENCEIGITRVDFDTNIDLESSALFFGSIFTDGGDDGVNYRCNPNNDMGFQENLSTGPGVIEMIRVTEIDPEKWYNNSELDPIDIEKFSLKSDELIDQDGTFAFPIPMNVGHVITDEFGNLVPSPDPSIGLPTKGMYRFKMKFKKDDGSDGKYEPASAIFPNLGDDFGGNSTLDFYSSNIGDYDALGNLRKKTLNTHFHTFEWKQLYTIAHYIKKFKVGLGNFSFVGIKETDRSKLINPFPYTTAMWKFNIIYYYLVFLVNFYVIILKFFIALISLCFKFCAKVKFPRVAFNLFGEEIVLFEEFCILCFCLQLCPFNFVGGLVPPITLPCETAPNGEGYELPQLSACNTTGCSGGIPVCDCGTCPKVFDIDVTGLSEDSNVCLEAINNWLCCLKLALADELSVIKNVFIDSWVFGTAYLFKFKYKFKLKDDGTPKEKYCGDVRNNFSRNRCCPDEERRDDLELNCRDCLIRRLSKENNQYDKQEKVYCNNLMPTKIVSLGRVEMCPETLEDIQNSTITEGPLKKYKQNYLNNNVGYIGTYYESGWDGNYWVRNLKETSYVNPLDVLLYISRRDCGLSSLFYRIDETNCHSNEFRPQWYYLYKEISKIYTEIELGGPNDEFSPDPNSSTYPYADMINPDPTFGGFLVNRESANRFSPCGGSNPERCNGYGGPIEMWSTNPNLTTDLDQATSTSWDYGNSYLSRSNKPKRNNLPYYYFGIYPGKTAITKLRSQYFTKNIQ